LACGAGFKVGFAVVSLEMAGAAGVAGGVPEPLAGLLAGLLAPAAVLLAGAGELLLVLPAVELPEPLLCGVVRDDELPAVVPVC
jgi:hypothetical protein